MIQICKKISKNFAFELVLFNSVRSLKDGISFFKVVMNLDLYKGDHKPSFNFEIELCNMYLIEFRIYNVNHYNENE